MDVSKNHGRTYIAVSGWRKDGSPHGELVAQRAGTAWAVEWFRERVESYGGMTVALQGRGAPVSSLIEDLEKVEGLTVVRWQGEALAPGAGAFYNAVCLPDGEGFRHLPQPALDVAAATAVTKPSGDAWLWDRNKSETDIAPLIAVNAAFWALQQKTEKPKRSAYEDRGLQVV